MPHNQPRTGRHEQLSDLVAAGPAAGFWSSRHRFGSRLTFQPAARPTFAYPITTISPRTVRTLTVAARLQRCRG
jgi:hypothetical protein